MREILSWLRLPARAGNSCTLRDGLWGETGRLPRGLTVADMEALSMAGPPGFPRRRLLRMCGAGAFGITLPDLLRLRAACADLPARDCTFGRARSVIMLFMSG